MSSALACDSAVEAVVVVEVVVVELGRAVVGASQESCG